jgi:hypothetical protein
VNIKEHTDFLGWGALLGGAIGTGVGVLLSLVFNTDPLDLGGIGLFLGFTVGGMWGDKVFWFLERYRAQIVREASLEARKQSADASKLPDWWPTDEELAASLNPQPGSDDEPTVTIIVPSPRKKPKRQKS